MNRQAVKKYVLDVINRQETDAKEKTNFFNRLIDNNLIDQNRLLKACINHYYSIQFKKNKGDRTGTIWDTAIEFEVSTKTIHNVIYKFPNVQLNF